MLLTEKAKDPSLPHDSGVEVRVTGCRAFNEDSDVSQLPQNNG